MSSIDTHDLVRRPLFIYVGILCVLTLLVSAGDTYNYFQNDYGILPWVNLGLNVTMFILLPLYLTRRVSLQVAAVIIVYFTMANVFFTNFYLRETGVAIWENNYLRDIPILFVYMFTLCLTVSFWHLVVYNLLHTFYCISMLTGSDSRYLEENTVTIICSLLGMSFITFWLVKTLKTSVIQNNDLRESLRLKEEKTFHNTIESKDRELTFQAMMLASNSEILERVAGDLLKLKDQEASEIKKGLLRIRNNIKFSEKNEIWNTFQRRFSEVNQDFVTNLKHDFPTLTASEIKLASLLSLDLSSKEIALLLGNTRESVDVSRSRLRKKMALPKEENLSAYLSTY